MTLVRREFLATVAVGGLATVAGCFGAQSSLTAGQETTEARTAETDRNDASRTGLPLADGTLSVQYGFENLRQEVVSGGPPKDGIPSIDEPNFSSATEANRRLREDSIVFGVVRDTEVKAYPQRILVWHEIANDTLAGTPVTISYCPLTGTAMGFERGETTFGVSGRLLNDNLVMYDRDTDSRWPQMLGTAISGQYEGRSLREFRLVWTTWSRWRNAHPETRVLSEDTGSIRDYDRDPYGSYTPLDGYYAGGTPLFPPLQTDDRLPTKSVGIGTRTSDGATTFRKETLRKRGLMAGEIAETALLAVYDPRLDTAYVYRNPNDEAFEFRDGRVVGPDGQTHAPAVLPLPHQYAFDAMWFAWAGFYPRTGLHD
ncbi:DUF3179 domain-containing (seleno)protein [Haladaptatus sp. DFWS20]|uniref:DUF3179 domain-containing protein n=1 Tax=Haladaptatus sp. DFWS20 TaxID=3403467 RepID=UPI003EB8185C